MRDADRPVSGAPRRGMSTGRKKPIRSSSQQTNPTDAVTPRVQRTDPVVRNDDVVILRTSGVHKEAGAIFQVHVGTSGPLPDQFTMFERAAVKGDELARKYRVGLFYLDSPHDPPFLVRDYR